MDRSFIWFQTLHSPQLQISFALLLEHVEILCVPWRSPLFLMFSCQCCRVLPRHAHWRLVFYIWSLMSIPVSHLDAPVRQFQGLQGWLLNLLPEWDQDQEVVPVTDLQEIGQGHGLNLCDMLVNQACEAKKIIDLWKNHRRRCWEKSQGLLSWERPDQDMRSL